VLIFAGQVVYQEVLPISAYFRLGNP
jgi:hypothetical protein